MKHMLPFILVAALLSPTYAKADVVVTEAPAAPAYYYPHSWLRIGPAVHYTFDRRALVSMDLAVTAPLGGNVSVGGRFGGLLATDPLTFGVPLDFLFDFAFSRFYLEALVGPWIFFEGPTVRAHVAAGLGIRMGSFSFGPEVGYLDPSGIIGFRFNFYL